MIESITNWLDGLTATQVIATLCFLFMGITWLGSLVIHPTLHKVMHGDDPSNEAIIHTAATFGLSYAVLLGLLSVSAFESVKNLVQTVDRESTSLSTLYRTAEGYPEPIASELKGQLRDYTRYVIDKDWPAHRRGLTLLGGEHRLHVFRQTLGSFEPTTKNLELLQNDMLSYLNAVAISREQRLAAVHAAIPNVMWYMVVVGAFIMIAFIWLLHMRMTPQFILGEMTAFGLAILIYVIYALDRPLRGAVNVTPEAFQSVYDAVMKWDEG